METPRAGLLDLATPRTEQRWPIAKVARMSHWKRPPQALVADLKKTAVADGSGNPAIPGEGEAELGGIGALRKLGFRVPRQLAPLYLNAPALASGVQPA